MPKKLTGQQAITNLISKGRIKIFIRWDSPSNEYGGIETWLFAKCSKGHSVHKSYQALMRKGCKTCGIEQRAKARTLSHEEAERRIYAKGVTQSILEWQTRTKRYEGKNSKFIAICSESGHIFDQSYDSHVNSGSGCRFCSRKYSPSNQLAIKRLNASPSDAHFVRWNTLSGLYENNKCDVTVRCSFGHEWSTTYGSVVYQESGCPECAGNKRLSEQKVLRDLCSKGVIQTFLKWKTQSGCYENNRSEFEAVCREGHHFKHSYFNHMRANCCPECEAERVPTTQQATANILGQGRIQTFNKWVTPSGGYERNTSKFEAICLNGHSFEQSYASHMRGSGCNECGNNVIKEKGLIPEALAIQRLMDVGHIQEFLGWHTNTGSYEGKESEFQALCKHGHSFEQSYHNHVAGHLGCDCANSGFRSNQPATFYLLCIGPITNPIAIKLGIANNLQDRIKRLSKRSNVPLYLLNHISFSLGREAQSLEKWIMSELNMSAVSAEVLPDGWTESFHLHDLSKLAELTRSYAWYHPIQETLIAIDPQQLPQSPLSKREKGKI